MDALTIKLPAELEISEVAQYHTTLVEMLSKLDPQQNIQIDASELWRVDTAGIQLLVALVSEASTQNRQLSWQKKSVELTECAQRLGLSDILLISNS